MSFWDFVKRKDTTEIDALAAYYNAFQSHGVESKYTFRRDVHFRLVSFPNPQELKSAWEKSVYFPIYGPWNEKNVAVTTPAHLSPDKICEVWGCLHRTVVTGSFSTERFNQVAFGHEPIHVISAFDKLIVNPDADPLSCADPQKDPRL